MPENHMLQDIFWFQQTTAGKVRLKAQKTVWSTYGVEFNEELKKLEVGVDKIDKHTI